jgi:hypothetical protein
MKYLISETDDYIFKCFDDPPLEVIMGNMLILNSLSLRSYLSYNNLTYNDKIKLNAEQMEVLLKMNSLQHKNDIIQLNNTIIFNVKNLQMVKDHIVLTQAIYEPPYECNYNDKSFVYGYAKDCIRNHDSIIHKSRYGMDKHLSLRLTGDELIYLTDAQIESLNQSFNDLNEYNLIFENVTHNS